MPFKKNLTRVLSGLFFSLTLFHSLPTHSSGLRKKCADALIHVVQGAKATVREIVTQPLGGQQVIEAQLKRPAGEDFKILQNLSAEEALEHDKLFYVVTPDDKIYFSWGQHTFDKNKVLYGSLEIGNNKSHNFPIKEAGEIKWLSEGENAQVGKFDFQKHYGQQLSQEEVNRFQDDLLARMSDANIKSSQLRHGFPKARVLQCTDALGKGKSAKKFVLTKLTADMTLLTGGILIQAPARFDYLLAEAGLEEKDHNRDYDEDMLAADYVTTSVNTVFKAWVGYTAATTGIQLLRNRFGKTATSMMMRTGASVTSIGLQTLIFAAMTDNDAKGIGMYNLGYSAFSMVKSHFVDNFIVHKLPKLAYDLCQQHPAWRFIVGQNTFRIVEGLASTVLYLGGRDFFVPPTPQPTTD